MKDLYQEELKRQQREQKRLEDIMRHHPKTQERDDQLQVQMEWLNNQK